MILADGTLVYNRLGDLLKGQTSVKRDIDAELEAYIRNTNDNNMDIIKAFESFINWLKLNNYYDNMIRIWLMSPISESGILVEFKGKFIRLS